MKNIKKLFNLLTLQERKQFLLLLAMIAVMAFLDLLGVASVMPFMAVLINPQIVETNVYFNSLYIAMNSLGVNTVEHFLFLLGILTFFLLTLSLAFRALTIYAQLRFAFMKEYSIGKRLLQGYLQQPYSWFLNHNSTTLSKIILSDVNFLITHFIKPIITVISQGCIVLVMLMLILVTNPIIAFIMIFVLGVSYFIITKFTNNILKRNGEANKKSDEYRHIVIKETFGALKEIKVGGLEKFYIEGFAKSAQEYAKLNLNSESIVQLPRFALELLVFGATILLVLAFMLRGNNFSNLLPIITLYIFASYRLIPSLMQVMGAIGHLRFADPIVNAIIKDLKNIKSLDKTIDKKALPLKKTINLKNIYFRYPNTKKFFLKGVNLNIPAGSAVGFVGASGSGKSTVVNLILGLLQAQKGTLEIDGIKIDKNNLRIWQNTIAYVPQQIYLTDRTVAANIALGINYKDIDQAAVERAAKIANLHDFVVNQIPLKSPTIIGDHGVRISGGQRQRIGIARALYHNPQVLILDEATNALDNITKQIVMNTINKLKKKITLIIIAHQLNTVKKCDTIFLMEKGEVKATGAFYELLQTSKLFQQMVKIK
jgi:ABC-type multidrug transport system fused ATPase/permease subunit